MFRTPVEQRSPVLHCNRGELLHIGVRHDAAIGKEQDTIVAKFLVGKFRDEATRNERRMREQLDELYERAQQRSRIAVDAADQSIDLSKLQHHRSIVVGIGHQGLGVSHAHFSVAVDFFKAFAESRQIGRCFGVHDRDVIEAHLFGKSNALDHLAVSDKDRNPTFFS